MIEFTMPALGADMDEGTLNEWLVKPGDKVTRGQIVAVVETTKAAVEIECWQEGTVNELLVAVGETVQVGAPLATLLAAGEEAQKRSGKPLPPAGDVTAPAPPKPHTAVKTPGSPQHRRWVSPAARRLAQSLHVDVGAVSGTGPQGAVTISDVEHAAAALAHAAAEERAAKTVTEPPAKTKPAERAALMRKSIAAAMSRSKREIPHYYLAEEIVLESALTWLTTRNAQRSIDERVLPAVLLLKAVGVAAERFGEFNGFWRDDGFQPANGVHVGVGISLRGGGLVAPAIHDVPEKKLDELMDDLTDLVARARSFSLRSSEMSDPTITVTNLGDQGVDAVFGVIYPPQVALVGFGQPAQRVCVIDGGIRVVTAVQATLAADHRASDGHRGALFLKAIDELLQQPDLLEK
ncbi:branched-chain alpha-keto acid dehydrogenase subunit E2 [Mycobacterium paraense]|uniref:Dihydrolipoamide acetyltransferase component of pyruvate dehydrogenase complex n=1 Tax=Mycobacterium paraense TaxID=767916 RepID=A0ABX3VNL9_9MYCO|nr:dihydrolipoamide acetyltransferase family protein [Mycobacterium paraense]ORW31164.1 branched-chain alpha-keto acid dehydrogenase subunit E2 [Mycobacterium paraense]ORW36192.1 branched-chain alpha-keto acid dehydrogenase subunit E2 [Mycobacterium paraense]